MLFCEFVIQNIDKSVLEELGWVLAVRREMSPGLGVQDLGTPANLLGDCELVGPLFDTGFLSYTMKGLVPPSFDIPCSKFLPMVPIASSMGQWKGWCLIGVTGPGFEYYSCHSMPR